MKESELLAAENFFHEKIPLTHAMGLRVCPDETNGFAIEAPVQLNSNHLDTAFGGSINAIATLAGYGLLWLDLRETAQIVVAKSSIHFLRPVRETIRAFCIRPAPSAWEAFRTDLREKRKSRITLSVSVEENGERAAEFKGTFLARANS